MDKRSRFAWWGIGLMAFPAVAGTLFALFMGAPSYVGLAVVFSYILWGWLPGAIGIVLLIVAMASGAEKSSEQSAAVEQDTGSLES